MPARNSYLNARNESVGYLHHLEIGIQPFGRN